MGGGVAEGKLYELAVVSPCQKARCLSSLRHRQHP